METFVIYVFIALLIATEIDGTTLIEEAVFITQKYYKHHFVTTVVSASEDDAEDINEFLVKFSGSVVVSQWSNNDTDSIVETAGYAQTVFFATNTEDFEKFLTVIHRKLKFSIRLVLIYTKVISEISELYDLNKIAWLNNLADLIIVSKSVSDINISTYYPYADGVCGNYNPVKLDRRDNLFPKKFNNFNKCPIRVTAVHFKIYVDVLINNGSVSVVGGYDYITLEQVKKTINASFQFNTESDGNGVGTYENGKATGSLHDMINNKTDMVIPAGILSLGRYSITQVTHAYHHLDIRWIGPKRREIYHWIKVLVPFLNIVTPLLVFAYLSFVLIVKLISRLKLDGILKNNDVYFQAFTLLVGQTADFITMVPMLNNLYLLWICFCFIIRIVYQGDLVDALQTPFLEQPFDKIEEAVTRVDNYGGTDVMLEFYRNTSLEKRFTVFPLADFYPNVDGIAEGKRFLVASDKFLIRRVRSSVQILDRQINSGWACFYMRPGWPAAPTISSIVLRLTESGFMEKLLNMDNKPFQSEINQDSNVKPLDMTTFSACFYIMAVIWVICLVIFIMEIIQQKYARNKDKYCIDG